MTWDNDPFGSVPNPFEANVSRQPPTFTSPPPPPRTNTLATLSVVFAVVLAPVGALLGHLGLAQIRRTGQQGRQRAIIGITVSYTVTIAAIVALVVWTVVGNTDPPAPVTAAPPSSQSGSEPLPTTGVSAVLDEPTCGELKRITEKFDSYTPGLEFAVGVDGADWTAEQRRLMIAEADTKRLAADEAVALIGQTPNPMVRQLYGQYVAHARAFADAVRNSSYEQGDGNHRLATGNVDAAVSAICTTIETGRPDVFASMVAPIHIDTTPPPPVDPINPALVITRIANCVDWANPVETHYSADLVEKDPAIGSQKADVLLDIGRRSENPLAYYLAAHGALYFRIAAVTTSDGPDEQAGYRNFGMAIWALGASSCMQYG